MVASGATEAQNKSTIDYAGVFRKSSPAVVVVVGVHKGTMSRGTGTIIDRSGLVLTNTHVVSERGRAMRDLQVFLKPARLTGNASKDLHHRYPAKLVAMHEAYDIALLQILRPPDGLPALPLSNLQGVEIGEPTAAIGHPGGGALWTLTTGKISAAYDDYKGVGGYHVFQTETAINPGNSGGPLLDGSGSIIGVNTFIVRVNREGIPLVGLSFAVKSTTVRTWITGVMGRLPSVSELGAQASAGKPTAPLAAANVEKAKPRIPTKTEATPGKENSKASWVAPAKKKSPRNFFEPRPFKRSKGGYSSSLISGKRILAQRLQREVAKKKKKHRKKQRKLDRFLETEQ